MAPPIPFHSHGHAFHDVWFLLQLLTSGSISIWLRYLKMCAYTAGGAPVVRGDHPIFLYPGGALSTETLHELSHGAALFHGGFLMVGFDL